ncbi:SAM-dependent methyltransferase [Streptantibioticus cattleyicolor]|uniref:S-adenosyl-L-methionine-dependent methyltransferase n=1 Tax=Streptantibioticus cattleyicolor (strain ATCC 35852 / DSM 46488 / JCM 4925 / NBRC 14057 / NRRL 8057) TaxID=1003195 RepID=F8JJA0_STREN|nr:SAM-dependent methyltransferase [Streptantibioticus cattleyicolor]AEW98790.1 putative methyltransferase [Streptantibioticus cattleyicolor NRRL 8057 = DSM 46488]CCB72159.1 putative S-adenosyl-L-methionine-dependent methyltransferase Franean1_4929 [Streptantibioticus cattleyicolor NRRL 8057 = DSM 46488]
MTTPRPLGAVSATAISVARARAYESARPDRLFHDPYAAAFVAAYGEPRRNDRTPGPLARALLLHVVHRTRFYDDRLLASGHRQVVLLAAGLDTRAYRLDWPPRTRLYEVDLPAVLDLKHAVLAERGAVPRCDRTAVPADLVDPGWPEQLRAAGFDPAEPTAWLVEGLLVYLTAEQAARLMTTVTALSAPGSHLALERGRDLAAVPPDPSVRHITTLWKGGLGPGTADWLRAHGWAPETHPLDAVAARHGRPLPAPVTTAFVTAVRQ